jgi:hypothetical protein
MGTDTNYNPRQISYLDVQNVSGKKGKSGLDSSGNYVDPWGNTFLVAMDYNFDNTLVVASGVETAAGGQTNETLRKSVVVFNIPTSASSTKATNSYRRVVKSW